MYNARKVEIWMTILVSEDDAKQKYTLVILWQCTVDKVIKIFCVCVRTRWDQKLTDFSNIDKNKQTQE